MKFLSLDSSDPNNRLLKYHCSKCGRIPQSKRELFSGCTCGNRLFKIVKNESLKPKASKKLDFLSIKEVDVGVYDINVGKILKQEIGLSKEKSKNIKTTIAGNDGIFAIKLD